MSQVSIVQIIRNKRDGKELSDDEIQNFISALGTSSASEGQIGAFLMAVYHKGLTPRETTALTKAMTFSGKFFRWPDAWAGTVVDKHATGGVGDKTSLVLAPALAACGLRVPMISGRGLAHTGGTLDKLESIPHFKVNLSAEEIEDALGTAGCCIVGQTDDIVPADKHLYRIRNITATVEDNNLIVASIISKKAAEGLDAMVLDVKFGGGAFMKDALDAEALAKQLMEAGASFGMKMSAVISRMEAPLGNASGNALEVAEAIETLQNNGPKDLVELVATLGGKLLESTGRSASLEEGKKKILEAIESGEALRRFAFMLLCQGVAPSCVTELCEGDKWKNLPKAPKQTTLKAESTGYIASIDALAIGNMNLALGCGPGPKIKYHPGVVLKKKPGDHVAKGEVILEVHHDNDNILPMDILQEAIKIVHDKPEVHNVVYKIL